MKQFIVELIIKAIKTKLSKNERRCLNFIFDNRDIYSIFLYKDIKFKLSNLSNNKDVLSSFENVIKILKNTNIDYLVYDIEKRKYILDKSLIVESVIFDKDNCTIEFGDWIEPSIFFIRYWGIDTYKKIIKEKLLTSNKINDIIKYE